MARIRRPLYAVAAVLLLLIVAAAVSVGPRLVAVTGIVASTSCSQVFGGHQPWDAFLARDLQVLESTRPLLALRQNSAEQSVTGYLLGIPTVKAVYHTGSGCVLEGSPADRMEKHVPAASSGGMRLVRATDDYPRLNRFVAE
ncbi:MAG: hypothetical protein AAF749_13585, partial [Pseudomonadota bacterium]